MSNLVDHELATLRRERDEARAEAERLREPGHLTDREIVLLYREWSEEFYAASWMAPSQGTTQHFIEWLQRQPSLDEGELELVEQVRAALDGAGS